MEVTGDPIALRQVIDNLLKNVRAHTPPGTATAVETDGSATCAVVEVEDGGPGLGDGDTDLVFERFFRSDPSCSPSRGAPD